MKSGQENGHEAHPLERLTVGNFDIVEYRDKETGIHYFKGYNGGLTVRLFADGTPYAD